MMIKPKSFVYAIILLAVPFLSHGSSPADSLPPVLTRWDTTQALSSVNEAMLVSTAENMAMFTWTQKDFEKRKTWGDSLLFFNHDDLSIAFYKSLLQEKKDPQHFGLIPYLLSLSGIVQRDRMEDLFFQYPKTLQESAAGKKILMQIRRNGEHEGRDISQLLTTTRMQSLSGKETTVSAGLDGRQFSILVIGASWCGPCKYQDRLLHQAAGNWDYSRFKIIHLSIDTDKKKWEADVKKAGHESTAYLLQGARSAALIKTLHIPGVPRYLVLNDQGKVLIDNSGSVRVLIQQLNERLRWQESALACLAMEWCESAY